MKNTKLIIAFAVLAYLLIGAAALAMFWFWAMPFIQTMNFR